MKIYHLAVLGQSVKWVGRAEFLPEPLGSFRRTHLLADLEGVGAACFLGWWSPHSALTSPWALSHVLLPLIRTLVITLGSPGYFRDSPCLKILNLITSAKSLL